MDSFARQSLWSVGLDYGHGTGHGVGMYLNVHEGPMGISWRVYPDDPGMQEGMFVSDGQSTIYSLVPLYIIYSIQLHIYFRNGRNLHYIIQKPSRLIN